MCSAIACFISAMTPCGGALTEGRNNREVAKSVYCFLLIQANLFARVPRTQFAKRRLLCEVPCCMSEMSQWSMSHKSNFQIFKTW